MPATPLSVFVATFTALVAVGVALLVVHGRPWTFHVTTPVPTQYVLTEQARTEMVATSRQPARFAAVLQSNLLKLKRFAAPSALLGDVVLTRAQAKADVVFAKYDPNVFLANATYLAAVHEATLEPLTAREFVTRAKTRQDGLYYLYDEPLQTDFGGDLLAMFPPGVVIDGAGAKSYLTLASMGAEYQGHYFEEPLFVAQMTGRAHIRLVPPANLSLLHPYPIFHPNHGFVQSPMGNLIHPTQWTHTAAFMGDLGRILEHLLYFNGARSAETFETTLFHGDILYIPPLWTYHTVFLNTSVQIRLATDSYEKSALEQIRAHGFAVTNVEHLTIYTLRKMIVEVVASVLDLPAASAEMGVEAFLQQHIVEGRLAPLYNRFSSVGSSTNFTFCGVHRKRSDPALDEQTTSFALKTLNQITEVFKDLARHLPDNGAARDALLADYIDLYVHKAIGADDAWAFFANCFDVGITNVHRIDGPQADMKPPQPPSDRKYFAMDKVMGGGRQA